MTGYCDKFTMSPTVQDAGIAGAISFVIGIIVTAGVAQVFDTPWELVEVLLAVGIASLFSGFFSVYFTDDNSGQRRRL